MAKIVKYENIRQHKRAINTENTWKTQHTERVEYGNLFPVCSLWTWADHYKNAICAIRRREREMTQTQTEMEKQLYTIFYFTTWAGPGKGRLRAENSNMLSTKAV